jgi:hypothetical protein
MAQARAGHPAAAVPLLQRAYQLTPAGVAYRTDIARALIQIRMLAAMQAQAPQARAQ